MGYITLDEAWESEPSEVLWRYMDLPRFVDLLQRQSLYFTRADRMRDKWEGAAGSYAQDYWRNLDAERGFVGDDYESRMADASLRREAERRHLYMNCWHKSPVESAAMWDLYEPTGRGIAIRSTWNAVARGIADERPIMAMTVRYVDYSNFVVPTWNTYYPFGYKRESFAHEREVRFIYAATPTRPALPGEVQVPQPEERQPNTDYENVIDRSLPSPPGHHVSVTLRDLVDEVLVAPEADDWFLEVVRNLCQDYGFSWQVSRSSLASGPIY